ncbi:MAG: hypothetical protein PHF17_12340 [Arcobacteraceae bacterium]|nr:hypothetical protein [Arcobacteraceae bacterium]
MNYTDPSGHWGLKSIVKKVSQVTKIAKGTSNVVNTLVVTPIQQTVAEGKRFESKHRDELKTAAIIWVGVYTGVTFGPGLAGSMEVTGAISTGAISGAVAGSASGFTAGTLYHQDASMTFKMTLNGAKAGAISGAVAGGVSELVGIKDVTLAQKVALRTVTGGLQSAVLHQDVEQGMMMGALTAGIFDSGLIPSGGNWFDQKTSPKLHNLYEQRDIIIQNAFSSWDSINYNQYKYGDLDEL